MRYTGIIGRPLKHTLSPLFQTRAFRSIGWDVDFRPMGGDGRGVGGDVDDIAIFGLLGRVYYGSTQGDLVRDGGSGYPEGA